MCKLKIISSLYSPNIGGGAELSTQTLAENLIKTKKVSILTLGMDEKEEELNNVKIKRIKIRDRSLQVISGSKNSNIKGISLLKKIKIRWKDYIKGELYEVYLKEFNEKNLRTIHTSNNMMYSDIFSCWKAAKHLNIKVIHTLRDPSLLCFRVDLENKRTPLLDNFHRFLCRRAVRHIDIVHSPSQFMIDLHKKYDFNFKEEIVIPNTVDCEIKKCNYSEKNNNIVYVGGIEGHKGVLTLIEAFSKLKNNNLKLILIGSGKLEDKIKKEYGHLNIEITGWLSKENVFEKINKSKILILPSEWDEAFGRVLVEGVYNATLVIGSDRGAIPEVLNYNKEYIYKAKNSIELKDKIEKILEINEEKYVLELKNMQEFMKKFSVENHIKSFNELYD